MKSNTNQQPLAVYFTDKGFFNSTYMNGYDLDGQIYVLEYLLRTQKWRIDNNKILFPELNDEKIKKLSAISTEEHIILRLNARLEETLSCSVYGAEKRRASVSDEINHHKELINSYKRDLEQYGLKNINDLEMEEEM